MDQPESYYKNNKSQRDKQSDEKTYYILTLLITISLLSFDRLLTTSK